jgi:hypothetical protein
LARKCREFGGIPTETNGGLREPRCVVVLAVQSEPLSAAEFPGNREKNRDFAAMPRNSRQTNRFSQGVSGKFPRRRSRESIRVNSAEQGLHPPGSGNWKAPQPLREAGDRLAADGEAHIHHGPGGPLFCAPRLLVDSPRVSATRTIEISFRLHRSLCLGDFALSARQTVP